MSHDQSPSLPPESDPAQPRRRRRYFGRRTKPKAVVETLETVRESTETTETVRPPRRRRFYRSYEATDLTAAETSYLESLSVEARDRYLRSRRRRRRTYAADITVDEIRYLESVSSEERRRYLRDRRRRRASSQEATQDETVYLEVSLSAEERERYLRPRRRRTPADEAVYLESLSTEERERYLRKRDRRRANAQVGYDRPAATATTASTSTETPVRPSRRHRSRDRYESNDRREAASTTTETTPRRSYQPYETGNDQRLERSHRRARCFAESDPRFVGPHLPTSSQSPIQNTEERSNVVHHYEPTPLIWRFWILAVFLFMTCLIYTIAARIGPRSQAIYGSIAIIALVALFSRNLNAVNWRTIFWGILMQLFIAWFVTFELYMPDWTGVPIGYQPGHRLFEWVSTVFRQFAEFSMRGSEFVFGSLATQETPIFAISVIPTIVFVSSFFTLLYYFGILQFIVKHISRVMSYFMGTSGAETLSSVANVFMGQTEAPLIVKPYIARMTNSELLCLMVGGMATISGSLMVIYVTTFKRDAVDLLATSLMAAPCSLYLAKLLYPETEEPVTLGVVKATPDKIHRNSLDAIAGGAADGLLLGFNVCAMLIAFIAIIAMVDALLKMIQFNPDGLRGWLGEATSSWDLTKRYFMTVVVFTLSCLILKYPFRWLLRRIDQDSWWESWKKAPWAVWIGTCLAGYLLFLGATDLLMRQPIGELSLQVIFSKLFHPLAMMMGVPWEDAGKVADLLGLKLVGNEFLAFQKLSQVNLQYQRSEVLVNFALCGFANFASIGIQIGGIGAMAPSRRADLSRLGMQALFIGFLTTILNAAIVGIFRAV